jgi:hypothetical protein
MAAYDEVLAQQILLALQEVFPNRLSSNELKDRPPFVEVPEEQWLLALDALFKLGLIEGKALRAGYRSALCAAANLEITSQGRESLSAIAIRGGQVGTKGGPSSAKSRSAESVARLHQIPADNPSTPPSVLKQAINAVPAVKYALGIGGIISVIAIVGGFGIDFRVAFWGTVVMLVLMTVLLVFAKASSRTQSAFKGPTFILTWFSLVLFMATATALFLSVFFGKPLDLRTLLAPAVHAEQTQPSALARKSHEE